MTFGNSGSLSLGFPGDPVALLPAGGDKSLVIAGIGQVQRRNADGSLDTAFGASGIATIPLGAPVDAEVISGGKLLVSGNLPGGAGAICRLNADGSLDLTFGTNGVANITAMIGLSNKPQIAVQPGGQIVVVSPGALQFARLTPDGALLSSGLDIPTGPFSLAALAIQSDGKILIGGSGLDANDNSPVTLMRLNAGGSVDTSFADQGFYSDTPVKAFAVQPDGRIVVAGDSLSGDLTVARLTTNGANDPTFGNTVVSGVHQVQLSFGTAAEGTQHVLVAPDGKVIFYDRTHLTRLTTGGSLDSTFGRVQTFGNNLAGATQLNMDGAALLSNGRLMIAGYDSSTSANGQLYRLQGDADPAGMFALSGGTLSINGTGGNDWIQLESGSVLVVRVGGGFGRVFNPAEVSLVSELLGAGDDVAKMGTWTGPTTVSGEDGNDSLIGGPGADSLSGNAGADRIDGGAGSDRLSGNGGRDKIRGQEGNDRVYGGGGNDSLGGEQGLDRFWGDAGDDLLTGNEGADTLWGGSDNDTFMTSDGEQDQLWGETGTDSAMMDAIDQADSVEDEQTYRWGGYYSVLRTEC